MHTKMHTKCNWKNRKNVSHWNYLRRCMRHWWAPRTSNPRVGH